MLPQPDRRQPAPQPGSYFMLHGERQRGMAFPSLITAPSCFPPCQCPQLSWAVAMGRHRVLCSLPGRGLVKTPVCDNSQGKALTAQLPASSCHRALWSKLLVWIPAKEAGIQTVLERGGGKSCQGVRPYTRWLWLQGKIGKFEAWLWLWKCLAFLFLSR